MTPERLAQLFHETYERLAPDFGYRTREATAKPWAEVPEANRRLMIATCAEVLDALALGLAETRFCTGYVISGGYLVHERPCPLHGPDAQFKAFSGPVEPSARPAHDDTH